MFKIILVGLLVIAVSLGFLGMSEFRDSNSCWMKGDCGGCNGDCSCDHQTTDTTSPCNNHGTDCGNCTLGTSCDKENCGNCNGCPYRNCTS